MLSGVLKENQAQWPFFVTLAINRFNCVCVQLSTSLLPIWYNGYNEFIPTEITYLRHEILVRCFTKLLIQGNIALSITEIQRCKYKVLKREQKCQTQYIYIQKNKGTNKSKTKIFICDIENNQNIASWERDTRTCHFKW